MGYLVNHELMVNDWRNNNPISINTLYGDLSYGNIWHPKLQIKDVIYNEPATIVIWDDGTKTVVKCDEEYDDYDPEYGFMLCCIKKMFGNTGRFNDIMKKWVWDNDKLRQNKIDETLINEEDIDPKDVVEHHLRTFSTKRLEATYKNAKVPGSIKKIIVNILRDRKRGIN